LIPSLPHKFQKIIHDWYIWVVGASGALGGTAWTNFTSSFSTIK
jgi:hypothetical protein